MAIRITALGTLRVEQDGEIRSRLPGQRVRSALLVYLAIEREVTRDAAMGLLWPDRPPDRARRLLNQTLYELRQELGERWVESVGDRLLATDELRIDADDFVRAVEAGDYESALRQYGGQFLAEGSLGVSRPMEGWIDACQARMTRLQRRARKGAIDARVGRGDLEGALDLARSWVAQDPLDDDGQHRLIELLAATGDRSAALAQYDRYAKLVDAELDLEPLDETREMVERIKDGEVGPRPAAPVPVPEAEAEDAPAADPATARVEDTREAEPRRHPEGSPRRTQALVLLAAVAVLVVTAVAVTREPEGPEQPEVENALDPRRIAVLYFNDFTGQDMDHLAAGFTEMLIDELSQVEELDVISRTAVSHYRDMRGNVLDSLRTHLAPGTVVEGSLMLLGDRLQLAVQLVDGVTASHIMSETLTAPADSASLLLDPLAKQAARMLRRRLGSEIELRETRAAAEDQEAWQLVQQGNKILSNARFIHDKDEDASLDVLDRADSLFARAQTLDPDWPEPLFRRAVVGENRAYIVSRVPSVYDSAAAAVALEHLDALLRRWPDHARALAMRGKMRFQLAEAGVAEPMALYDGAEADLRRATLEDGNLAEAWWGLSRLLYRRGEYAEAEQAALQARRTDMYLSSSEAHLWHLFQVSLNLEDFDDAARWCTDLGEHHPGTQSTPFCEILLLVSSPRIDPDVARAWELSRRIVDLGPRSDTTIFRRATELYVARVLIRAGMRDSAQAVLDRVVPGEVPRWAAYDVAHTRLMLGDEEGALEALGVYVDAFPGRAQSLDDDWWMRRLHGDPRFEELVGIGPG